MQETDPNLDDLVLLEDAARQAGDIALSFFGGDPRTWFKDNKSPVSEADLEVDGYLAEVLRTARPGYGWLSEESADSEERLARPRTFIVDPIDGTRAFLAGGDEWTVALAVVDNGRPVAGVVFCPVRKELFSAVAGHGATLNGERMTVSGHTAVKGARPVGASFHRGERSDSGSRVRAHAECPVVGLPDRSCRSGTGGSRGGARWPERLGPCGCRSFGAGSGRQVDRPGREWCYLQQGKHPAPGPDRGAAASRPASVRCHFSSRRQIAGTAV